MSKFEVTPGHAARSSEPYLIEAATVSAIVGGVSFLVFTDAEQKVAALVVNGTVEKVELVEAA